MIDKFRKSLQREDVAVSAVIGTILMVAATVILGATIYAAINAFGDRANTSSVDAVFRATAIDTNANGLTDSVRVTFLKGPPNIAPQQVLLRVMHEDSGIPVASSCNPIIWDDTDLVWIPGVVGTPGNFTVCGGGQVFHITAVVSGNVVLDTTIVTDDEIIT